MRLRKDFLDEGLLKRMFSENGDSGLPGQIRKRSDVSELPLLRKSLEAARLAWVVFEDEKSSASERLLCVAEDMSEAAHAVETAVQREGGIETCHFGR